MSKDGLHKFFEGSICHVIGNPRLSIGSIFLGLSIVGSVLPSHAMDSGQLYSSKKFDVEFFLKQHPSKSGNLSEEAGSTEAYRVVVSPKNVVALRAISEVVPPSGRFTKSTSDDPEDFARPLPPTDIESFNAPSSVKIKTPPHSLIGVKYTWTPVMHEHVMSDGESIIIQGGLTDRRLDSISSTYGDPSDAFMNIAVHTYMKNTGRTFESSVRDIESSYLSVRDCFAKFGSTHDCSASQGGITFDYSQRVFSAKLMQGGKPSLTAAVERLDYLYVGPGLKNVVDYQTESAPLYARSK